MKRKVDSEEVRNELRVKIDKEKQVELFKEVQYFLKSRKLSCIFLDLKEGTYKGYASAKTRYLPFQILNNICKKLKKPLPIFLETDSLTNIRKKTISKTYMVLEEKYGKDWLNVIAKKGHKSLEEKYGKDWRRILALKGHETSKLRYGLDFQKKIWQKAITSLEEKYGVDWPKINALKSKKALEEKYGSSWAKYIMSNAREGLKNKYGENYMTILSKRGAKALAMLYGPNYRKYLYEKANLIESHPLTNLEIEVCLELTRQNILYETHREKNGFEYDIIIPSLNNPKIVLECSNLKPNTIGVKNKVLQLIEQKNNFPNSLHLALLKRKSKKCNCEFNHAAYSFLRDQKIYVFWIEDYKLLVKLIKKYLKGEKKNIITEFKYSDFNIIKTRSRSYNAALAKKNIMNKDELKLHNLLTKLGNPFGQYPFKTKYYNWFRFDNYEEIGKLKIAYEITSAKTQRAMFILASKIAWIKKSSEKIKFITLLSQRKKITSNFGDRALLKYSDVVILKNQINFAQLKKYRKEVLKS